MKIGARETGLFLKQPDKQSKAVLLYGPDSGLVRERSRIIADTILGKNADPLNRIELNGAQLKTDPALLLDELNSMSLMGGRRVVILRDPVEKIEPVIKSAFEGFKGTTFLIIEADELAATSALRKLFEKENHLAAIACYHEDNRALEDVIRSVFSKYGLQVTHDAMLHLIANLGNDRAVTQSELEKIALYMGAEKEVTLPIVSKLTDSNADESVEDLCHAIASCKAATADKLLHHLLHDGTQPVAIIRSLIRYFQRLDLVQGHVQAGNSREQAITMLRPPVFFKSVDIIKNALAHWDAGRISYCLNLLLRTEKELKSGLLPPELIISNAMLAIHSIQQKVA